MNPSAKNKPNTDEILIQLLKITNETAEKVEYISQQLIHINDISRKINAIYQLHFPKDAMEKNSNLTEKFLAEIILGTPRKRQKK